MIIEDYRPGLATLSFASEGYAAKKGANRHGIAGEFLFTGYRRFLRTYVIAAVMSQKNEIKSCENFVKALEIRGAQTNLSNFQIERFRAENWRQ